MKFFKSKKDKKIEQQAEQIALFEKQRDDYMKLARRFLVLENIHFGYYPFTDAAYPHFEAYVSNREQKVAEDLERRRIRKFIEEIRAEDAASELNNDERKD